MSNLDIPAGFKPVKNLNGSPWNGKPNVYYIPVGNTATLFIGDAVKSGGAADATGMYPTVTKIAAGNAIRGVIIGFGLDPYIMVNPDNLNMKYCPAATAMYCLVVDDPDVIFEVQEDSVGGAIAAESVGLSVDVTVPTGSTTTGKSAMELDSSGVVATVAQCKILRAVNRPDNELGNNCKWEVLIREHEMLLATGV